MVLLRIDQSVGNETGLIRTKDDLLNELVL